MAVKSSALAKCKLYTNDGMRNKIAHDADWNFNIFSYLNPFYRKMEKFVLLPFGQITWGWRRGLTLF